MSGYGGRLPCRHDYGKIFKVLNLILNFFNFRTPATAASFADVEKANDVSARLFEEKFQTSMRIFIQTAVRIWSVRSLKRLQRRQFASVAHRNRFVRVKEQLKMSASFWKLDIELDRLARISIATVSSVMFSPSFTMGLVNRVK